MASMFAKPSDMLLLEVRNIKIENACKFMKMNSFCIRKVKTKRLIYFDQQLNCNLLDVETTGSRPIIDANT